MEQLLFCREYVGERLITKICSVN